LIETAITGLGIVSACGSTLADYWQAVQGGTPRFTPRELPSGKVMTVGSVNDEAYLQGLPLPRSAPLDRSGGFAVAAAMAALADAGIALPFARPERVAVVIGNGAGGQSSMEEQYKRLYRENKPKCHPGTVVRAMVSASASWVSMATGAQGPCFVTSSACASATHAIGMALALIRSGQADVAITGGTEACLTEGTLLAWEAMRVVSAGVNRPFAKGRDGLLISEGAGLLVLESVEHARSRGRDTSIRLAGFASNADAGDIVAPSVNGMTRAMQAALADAGMATGEVSYVNAHGTGTHANDIAETAAMKAVFGAGSCPPVSSTKSVVGHALGASGGLEAVATVLAMRHGILPPTANYDEPDPECDLDYVPNKSREAPINAALSNSFAFGGLNSTLAFRRA
jgi:nodulation protein E